MVGPTIFVAGTPVAFGSAVQASLRPAERRWGLAALVLALAEAITALLLLRSLLAG
ncbi:MAG TPA: hypothetical protein VFD43_03705 [Planctomycetota bacterium]|nr:hypothetical protein [Planctomycetota bacterium]